MEELRISGNKATINRAERIIITLHSGSKYIYDGIFQYKCHENGNWSYCDNYSSNYEYINSMYAICMIESIELLYKDSNLNKTIYE